MSTGAVKQLTLDDDRKARLEGIRNLLQLIAHEMLTADMFSAENESTGLTHGVTFDQVRIRAETRGILTGEEEGRTLSFGAALMKAAGGVPCEYRASKHRKSHGRTIRVFRLPPAARK